MPSKASRSQSPTGPTTARVTKRPRQVTGTGNTCTNCKKDKTKCVRPQQGGSCNSCQKKNKNCVVVQTDARTNTAAGQRLTAKKDAWENAWKAYMIIFGNLCWSEAVVNATGNQQDEVFTGTKEMLNNVEKGGVVRFSEHLTTINLSDKSVMLPDAPPLYAVENSSKLALKRKADSFGSQQATQALLGLTVVIWLLMKNETKVASELAKIGIRFGLDKIGQSIFQVSLSEDFQLEWLMELGRAYGLTDVNLLPIKEQLDILAAGVGQSRGTAVAAAAPTTETPASAVSAVPAAAPATSTAGPALAAILASAPATVFSTAAAPAPVTALTVTAVPAPIAPTTAPAPAPSSPEVPISPNAVATAAVLAGDMAALDLQDPGYGLAPAPAPGMSPAHSFPAQLQQQQQSYQQPLEQLGQQQLQQQGQQFQQQSFPSNDFSQVAQTYQFANWMSEDSSQEQWDLQQLSSKYMPYYG